LATGIAGEERIGLMGVYDDPKKNNPREGVIRAG